MKASFTGTAKAGSFVPDKAEGVTKCLRAMDGKQIQVTIQVASTKTSQPKSHSQVKMIFGLMIDEAVRQAEEKTIGVEDLMIYLLANDIPKGQAITKDYLHQLMYIICPTTDEKGNQTTLSKMDTVQAASLFERFRNTVAGIGIYIPDPKKKLLPAEAVQ
ncbi:hypothetical protein KAR91_50585 [Candidatus Pacearchaeota archaeon]|nr:hypothetical protein [Candidatus Pacearchaeota archaeon]